MPEVSRIQYIAIYCYTRFGLGFSKISNVLQWITIRLNINQWRKMKFVWMRITGEKLEKDFLNILKILANINIESNGN